MLSIRPYASLYKLGVLYGTGIFKLVTLGGLACGILELFSISSVIPLISYWTTSGNQLESKNGIYIVSLFATLAVGIFAFRYILLRLIINRIHLGSAFILGKLIEKHKSQLWISKRVSSDISAQLSIKSSDITNVFLVGTFQLTLNISFCLSIVAIGMAFQPFATATSICLLAGYYFFVSYRTKQFSRSASRSISQLSGDISFLSHLWTNQRAHLSVNMEAGSWVDNSLLNSITSFKRIQSKSYFLACSPRIILEFLIFAIAIIMFSASRNTFNGASIPDVDKLIFAVLVFLRFVPSIQGVYSIYSAIRTQYANIDELVSLGTEPFSVQRVNDHHELDQKIFDHLFSRSQDNPTVIQLSGPSGSGKSSIVMKLLGRIFEEETNYGYAVKSDIYYLNDKSPEYSDQRLKETHLYSCAPEERRMILEYCIELGVINKYNDGSMLWHRQFSSLSRGEVQRLYVAYGLALRKKFWILDEATSGLDISNELAVLGLIRKCCSGLLFISHSISPGAYTSVLKRDVFVA